MELLDLYETTQSQEFFLFYPTGSGKTRKACEFAQRLMVKRDIQYVIIIVPHSRHIQAWHIETHNWIGSHQFSVSTMNSFYHSHKCVYDSDRITLFILDECHNYLPKTFLSKRLKKTDTKSPPNTDNSFSQTSAPASLHKSKYFNFAPTVSLSDDEDLKDENANDSDNHENNEDNLFDFETERYENENANKIIYYTFLKDIFSRNHSRIILGLSATPFSNNIKLEIDAYYDLVRMNLPNYKQISRPSNLAEDVLKNDSLQYFNDTFTLSRLYYFSNRCVFPTDKIFSIYKSKVYFGTNEIKYLSDNHINEIIPGHDNDHITYVQSTITNLTSLHINVPLYLIENSVQRQDHLLRNIHRVEKLYENLQNTPIKQLIVTYHLKLRTQVYNFLKNEPSLRNYQKIQLIRTEDASLLHDQLQQFNYTNYDSILITNTFLSEGLGLRNVAGVHLFEPFQRFTTPATVQILGRSCRYESHNEEMVNHFHDGHAHVFTYLYGIETDLTPIRKALQKETAIRCYLVAIKDLQNEIFSNHLHSINDSISNEQSRSIDETKNIFNNTNIEQVSNLMYNIQHYNVNSLMKMLDMALQLDDSNIKNTRISISSTGDTFQWFNCSLLKAGLQLIDTSDTHCRTLLYNRQNGAFSYHLADFILRNRIPANAIIISGTPLLNMSRHKIEQTDIDTAEAIIKCDESEKNINTKIEMRKRTIKGAKLKIFNAESLYDVAKQLPNADLQYLQNLPNPVLTSLREYIYKKSVEENRYWDLSKIYCNFLTSSMKNFNSVYRRIEEGSHSEEHDYCEKNFQKMNNVNTESDDVSNSDDDDEPFRQDCDMSANNKLTISSFF